jgi:sterol desaturase/sphingolipid hydroxylase (fatty acid hydroxylase superfamily)
MGRTKPHSNIFFNELPLFHIYSYLESSAYVVSYTPMTLDADMAPSAPSEDIVGPFTEMRSTATELIWSTLGDNIPFDLHWRVLSFTLLIAATIWFLRNGKGSKGAEDRARQSGFLEFIFPRDVYTHQSARVDVWLWISERLIHPFWAVGLLATVGPATENAVISALQWIFGQSPALQSNYAWMLLYSLALLLCYDFVFFLTHYAMHRYPTLWAIHKVHHSAEVLTPLTRYREHFIDGPIWASGAAVSYGFAAGVFSYLFNGGITEATMLNLGFFAVFFGFNGSFRHYHVQFHYPRWLAKWLHSPVMHHVHHSYLRQHWDKNFAAVTSIWDRIFGTLYIPEKDEFTPWGLGPDTQSEYRSFWQNTTGPFRDWRQMWLDRKDSKIDPSRD